MALSYTLMRDAGEIAIVGKTTAEAPEDALLALIQQIDSLDVLAGVTDEDLEIARQRREIEDVLDFEAAATLAPSLADWWVSGGYGWLTPKKDRRRAELRSLVQERRAIVLMDTPYRLVSLMRDLAETFRDTRRVCIAFNLTMADEQVFHGTAPELYRRLSEREMKGEFGIVIEGRMRDPAGRTG